MAQARHHEKLGRISIGFVGSGCVCVRIEVSGLVGSDQWISKGLEGLQGIIVRLHEDIRLFSQL